MRIAGDKRLVVRDRYHWKIFEQNVTVAYFKNQPQEMFCKKVLLKILPISQENTCAGVSL